MAGPASYALAETSATGGGMSGTNPTAGPSTGGGMGGPGGGGGRAGGGFPGGGSGGPGQQSGQQQGGQAESGQQQGGQMGTPPSGGIPSGAPGGSGQQQGGQPGGMGGGGGGMGPGGGGASDELITYLKKHQDGAKWLLAVSNSQGAAQLIVSSGEPVISMWGWTGTDKAMTLAKLKELVKKGELHYIQLGGGMGRGGGTGGSGLSSEVTAWVQKNGTAVKESEYSGSTATESANSSGSSSSSGSSGSSVEEGGSSAQSTSSIYRLDASDVG